MADYLISGQTLSAIADAIRAQGGFYDNITPMQMPSYIINNLMSQGDFAALIDKTISSVSNKVVYNVGDYAFYNCSNLSYVSFPECVDVGLSAFYSCSAIETLYLPKCTSTGSNAFLGCTNIKYLNLGITANILSTDDIGKNTCKNVNLIDVSLSQCGTIGASVFDGCTALQSAYIPNAPTLGQYAFRSCYALEEVSIANCTSIGHDVFQSCSALSQVIAPKASYIGNLAFQNCLSLKYLEAPVWSTYSASYHPFKNTPVLSEVIAGFTTLPNIFGSISSTLTRIQNNGTVTIASNTFKAFGQLDLERCYFDQTLSLISSTAFYGCPQISGLYASTQSMWHQNPDQQITIGFGAFQSCPNLKEVNLTNIKHIDSYAFANCASLSKVNIDNITMGTFAFYTTPIETVIMNELLSVNQSYFSNMSTLRSVQMVKCSQLNANAFHTCPNLEVNGEIDFPEVNKIDAAAFYACSSLSKLSFPKVSYLGHLAFGGCTNVSYISMPEMYTYKSTPFVTTTLGTNIDMTLGFVTWPALFQGFSNFSKITGPSCTSLAQSAFKNCNNLKSVNFPLCTAMAANAFMNCPSLTNIYMPQLTNIPNQAFESTAFSKLPDSMFPAVSSGIGAYAFRNNTVLSSINWPSITGTIGSYAFQNCTALTYVSFPDITSVATGSNYLPFTGCVNLVSANFNGLTVIPRYLISSNMTQFKDLEINGALTLNSYAFHGCSTIEYFNLPAVTKISASAFQGCTLLTQITVGTSNCALQGSNAFSGTGITSSTGHIYVGEEYIDYYTSAAQWSYFKDIISPMKNFYINNIEQQVIYPATSAVTWSKWWDSGVLTSVTATYSYPCTTNGSTSYITSTCTLGKKRYNPGVFTAQKVIDKTEGVTRVGTFNYKLAEPTDVIIRGHKYTINGDDMYEGGI